jgi:acyl-coenzyme A synthetase/AMP-(fatty) acid ligase
MPDDRRPAIVAGERTIDHRSLEELTRTVEAALAATVGPEAPLGIWVDDPVDFATATAAAMAVGADAFLLPSTGSSTTASELCDLEGGSTVLCDRAHAAQLTGVAQRSIGRSLVLVETAPEPSPPPERPTSAGQGSLHFYSSGTDGRPKGIVRTKHSLDLEDSTVGGHLGMASGCAVLCALPLTHGYGYTAGFSAPRSFGGTSIVAQPKMAASLAKLLHEHRPEVVVAVPAQYAAWSALRERYDGPLPRIWLCGGAPLPPAVRARFQDAWHTVICEQYGMTECGAITVDLEGTETLGQPYPGNVVRIDGGKAAGDVGEVVVSTPYGPRGYIGEPPRDRPNPFTPDGVRSGDQGWLDGDGRLHLVGRRTHQLNVRGEKVDPGEVERALWSVDGVRNVAVIGVDRAVGDQWIAAFVACADSVRDDVLHRATANLESYKRPQRLIRLPALPRNAAGKTDLEALRAIARSGTADG